MELSNKWTIYFHDYENPDWSHESLFFSPKLGYEALTSLPKDMFFGSGEQLSTVLAIMDSHGVPAEATFYKLQSGDTFRIPPKFNFLLFCIFVSKRNFDKETALKIRK